MHADASRARGLPIHQVMPGLHILADYSSLQLPARLDVLDAFTFDLQTMLMLKKKNPVFKFLCRFVLLMKSSRAHISPSPTFIY